MSPPPGLTEALRPVPYATDETRLPLSLAQRGFAVLIDTGAGSSTFRFAQLRGGARQALSALSADDRARLARWLGLLMASRSGGDVDARLLRVDATLAAAVASIAGVLREEWRTHPARGTVAA